jgi:hypothetical protein
MLSFSGPNPRLRWTGSSQPFQGDTAGHQESGSGTGMQMPLQETADQQTSLDGTTLSPTAGPLQHEIAGQMKLEQQLIAKWMGGPHSILKFMLARVRVGQVFRGNLVDGARL